MTKLYRSRRDSKLFGVCGGLAEMFNVDATLLRLIVVVTAILSSGTLILIYFIAAMVIPLEPKIHDPYDDYGYEDRDPYRPGPRSHDNYERYQRYTNPRSEQRRNKESKADKDELDEMMKDIEKKAMQKELEELKAKLAKYEKGDV